MPSPDSSLSAILRRADPAADAADLAPAAFAAGVRARIRAVEAARNGGYGTTVKPSCCGIIGG